MALQTIIIEKLKEFGLKLGVVETSTNGMVSSTIATYSNYEEVFSIGFIVRNSNLLYKFDIDKNENFITRTNARKLAKYIHDEYDCDVVLSIVSTSNDPNLKELKENIDIEHINNPNGHAYISILLVDRYEDFELQFKSNDELRDRLLITNKAMNELLYVIMKLK